MSEHRAGTREEWLAARRELLDAEKRHSRRGDEIARMRQELPWVPIEKTYNRPPKPSRWPIDNRTLRTAQPTD